MIAWFDILLGLFMIWWLFIIVLMLDDD